MIALSSFSVWWCMAVFCWCSHFQVNSVCAQDLSLLNSVKYDSILISVPLGRSTVFYYLRINFSMHLQFSIYFYFFGYAVTVSKFSELFIYAATVFFARINSA